MFLAVDAFTLQTFDFSGNVIRALYPIRHLPQKVQKITACLLTLGKLYKFVSARKTNYSPAGYKYFNLAEPPFCKFTPRIQVAIAFPISCPPSIEYYERYNI